MTQPIFNNRRYNVIEHIGEGGMGSVYKVYDRLTREVVALKRVRFGETIAEADDSTEERRRLAREFGLLASLRHPNIVNVRDYGFDAERQPFYTMDYLGGARELLDVAAERTIHEKIDLLIEVLEALAYLHRHGIVHRDVKPSNAVVLPNGTVKVLDFGLAEYSLQVQEIAGSLAYMAPEVMKEAPISTSADLYAVGVLAYECFVGEHPFYKGDYYQLIQDTLNRKPDPTPLEALESPVLQEFILRLLAKTPLERYPGASTALGILKSIRQGTQHHTTVEIQDSYLQAAPFIGRETELEQLNTALNAIIQPGQADQPATPPQGGTWLIGGESGVGKSRLLDELRIRAMVQGVTVLKVQGVVESRWPYEIWRDALRILLLDVTPSNSQAIVLQSIVPDIETLVGADFSDTIEPDATTRAQLLPMVIVDIFLQQKSGSVLLLVDDAHWAMGSISLLKQLMRLAPSLPLLIVAAYRSDDYPYFYGQLPDANQIQLERLNKTNVVELSAAMLGDHGEDEKLVDLLHKETEGNTLFLVEVVRALAEDAGDLARIGTRTLPASVFTRGVQHILQQRLQHIPQDYHPMLRLAAVIGREIKTNIMEHIDDEFDYDDWLMTCAEAAILSLRDGVWMFAHDRLRDAVLDGLEPEVYRHLNRLVANALEEIHTDDPHYAGRIAEHLLAADEDARAVPFLINAAEWLRHYATNVERAEGYFLRAEVIIQQGSVENSEQYLLKIYDGLTWVYTYRVDHDKRDYYWQHHYTLAHKLNHSHAIGNALNQQAMQLAQRGDFDNARTSILEVIALGQQHNIPNLLIKGYNGLGSVEAYLNNHKEAQKNFEACLAILQEQAHPNPLNMGAVLNNLGVANRCQGNTQQAQAYFQQAVKVREEIRDRAGLGSSYGNLGNMAAEQGQFEQALDYHLLSLEHFQIMQDSVNLATALRLVAVDYERLGRLQAALEHDLRGLEIAQSLDIPDLLAMALEHLAKTYSKLTQPDLAISTLIKALDMAPQLRRPNTKLLIVKTAAYCAARNAHPLAAAEWVATLESYAGESPELAEEINEEIIPLLEHTLTAEQRLTATQIGKNRDLDTTLSNILALFG